jgi:hypothetical protein
VRRHRSARARTPAAKVTAAASRLASAQGATARIDELARAMGIVIGAVLAPLLG